MVNPLYDLVDGAGNRDTGRSGSSTSSSSTVVEVPVEVHREDGGQGTSRPGVDTMLFGTFSRDAAAVGVLAANIRSYSMKK
jgi:hypothetical protein